MQDYRSRPLTRHENNIRLLFQHADEIVTKLDFLNSSVDKLERIELMINGFEGSPGMIELLEGVSFEINRLDRWSWRASGVSINEVLSKLEKIESMLNRQESNLDISWDDKVFSLCSWKIKGCVLGGVALGVINLLLFVWSVFV